MENGRGNSTEVWKEYKKRKQSAKKVISSAKEKKEKECASDLNGPEHQNEIFRIAKQMVREKTGSNRVKLSAAKSSQGQLVTQSACYNSSYVQNFEEKNWKIRPMSYVSNFLSRNSWFHVKIKLF